MLRAAVLSMVASCLCATIVPVEVAAASPAPSLGLDTILASPPTTDYQEIDPSTPGILEGAFDADGYASIGGPDTSATVKTLAADGFIAGFGRAWVHAASHRVLVEIVVAFTGGKGASKWLSQSQEADLADPTYQYAIAVDGIDSYYGARLSDSTHYFADAFVFVKGNDGFLVSTISDSDNLGDSAAAQTRVQYRRAPAYTIPPSGWPGATRGSLLATLTDLGPRLIAAVAAAGVALWLGVTVWMRARRRRAGVAAAAQDAGLPNGL